MEGFRGQRTCGGRYSWIITTVFSDEIHQNRLDWNSWSPNCFLIWLGDPAYLSNYFHTWFPTINLRLFNGWSPNLVNLDKTNSIHFFTIQTLVILLLCKLTAMLVCCFPCSTQIVEVGLPGLYQRPKYIFTGFFVHQIFPFFLQLRKGSWRSKENGKLTRLSLVEKLSKTSLE